MVALPPSELESVLLEQVAGSVGSVLLLVLAGVEVPPVGVQTVSVASVVLPQGLPAADRLAPQFERPDPR